MGIFRGILDEVEDVGRGVVRKMDDAHDYMTEPLEDGFNPMDILSMTGRALDAPRTLSTMGIGEGNYRLAQLRHKVGLEDDADMRSLDAAYRRGGGREVWEDEIIADVDNQYLRGAIDIAVDPLSWAGVGLVNKAGRGVQGVGKMMAGADNLSPAKAAIARGVQGTGRVMEGTGSVLRSPDKYVFDPAVGGVVKHMVADPARVTGMGVRAAANTRGGKALTAPLRKAKPLADRVTKPAGEYLKKQLELTPFDAFRERSDRMAEHLYQMWEGNANDADKIGSVDAYKNMHGEVTDLTEAGENRAAIGGRLGQYRGSNQAQDVRNQGYQSDVVNAILTGRAPVPVYAGSLPKASNVGTENRDSIVAARQMWKDRQIRNNKRSSPTESLPNPSLGITPVTTSSGVDIPVWDSIAERDTYAKAASKILISKAPVDGSMSAVDFATRDIFQLEDDFIAEHAEQGMTKALWPDVYRRAKEFVEADTDIKLPHERMSGDNPLGGGLDHRNATDEQRQQYAKNVAAASIQLETKYDDLAYDLANEIRTRGAAAEFTPGGAYHGPESLRQLAADGGVGKDGLRLATFEQSLPYLEREFGGIQIDEARQLYDLGLEEYRIQMVAALKPKTIKTYARKEIMWQGALMNNERAADLVAKGASGIDFYGDEILEMRGKFESNEDFLQFIDFLVVTSVHTDVTSNVTKAVDAWTDKKIGQTDTLRELGYSEEEALRINSFTPDNVGFVNQEGFPEIRRGVDRVISGTETVTPKLRSYRGGFLDQLNEKLHFEANEPRAGDTVEPDERQWLQREAVKSRRKASGVVTNDMWNQLASFLPESPTLDQYQMQEAVGRFISDRYDMTPPEVQAAVWSGIKGDVGYPIGPKGVDESPMQQTNARLDGRDGGPVYKDMEDYVRNGGLARWIGKMDEAENVVSRTLRAAAIDGGETVWRPSLRGGSGAGGKDLLRASDDSAAKVAKKGEGINLVSHRIPAGSDMTKDMLKFKLIMDRTMSRSWDDVFLHVKADTPNGDVLVDLVYHPKEGKNPGLMANLQKRINRERDKLGDEQVTDEQFRIADTVMEGWVKNTDRATSIRAKSTRLGNDRPLPVIVGQQADEFLARVVDPEDEAYGASFRVTNTGLEPMADDAVSYPVSITSAGKGGLLDGSKDNSRDVSKFVRSMENVLTGVNDDLVFFGAFDASSKGPGMTSFDMNVDAQSLDEALEIGALTNQISVWDNAAGEDVELTRGLRNSDSPFKTAEQVEELLDIITDARRNGIGPLDEAAKRGYFVAGETPNPNALGIIGSRSELMKRNGPQFLQRGKKESMVDYVKRTASPQLNQMDKSFIALDELTDRVIDARRLPGQEELRGTDAYRDGVNYNLQMLDSRILGDSKPFLADEVNNSLFNTKFEDGESIGKFAERTEQELFYDKQVLDKLGIRWDSKEKFDVASLSDDDEVRTILKKWKKLGISPSENMDSKDLTTGIVREKMAKEAGIVAPSRNFYDKAKGLWSEQALASLRYPAANLTTNTFDAMITGHFNFGSPMDAFRFAAAELKDAGVAEYIAGTKADELFRGKYGLGADFSAIGKTTGRMVGRDEVGKGSQMRRVLESLGFGGKLGKLAIVVEIPLAFAQGLDSTGRLGILEDVFEKNIEKQRATLLGKMDRIAANAGVDTTGMNMLPSYNPAVLKNYYDQMGFGEGFSETASRQMAEVINTTRKEARTENDRIFLTYRKTNLDEKIGKVIPFHYWASRKVRFYAEEAYRNPMLAANYARLTEGLAAADDEPGLSARQKGFMKVMAGPGGFTLLMNPDALMGVIKAAGLQDRYTPDGQTEAGGMVQWLKGNGVGLYPWIDGALNMMGMYGDTFEPDMIGIRHRGLVGATVNWMRGEGMLGDENRNQGAAPYSDLSASARESVSTWVSSFTPDWLSQPVLKKDIPGTMNASLDQVIESRIISRNPDMTNGELIEIMNDPDSEAYGEAFRDVARAGVLDDLLSFTLPVSFRAKEDARDVRTAKTLEVSKEADRLGIMPHEVDNSVASMEFRANYKRQTGEEFTANAWKDAKLETDMMRATPEARTFVVKENEYQSIQSEEVRPIISTYYDILSGTNNPTGIGFQGQMSTQVPEVRQFWADQYLKSSGKEAEVKQVFDLQRAYKQAHPDFGEFKNWQSQMYDLQSALGGSLQTYRAELSKQNPYAAQYFKDTVSWLQKQGVAPADMQAELDRVTANSSTWFAVKGQAKTIYDPQSQPQGGDVQQDMLAPYADTQYNMNQGGQQGYSGGENWSGILTQLGQNRRWS